MTQPNSINVQSALVLARCVTDGAGAITTSIPQQGVGATSWTFTGATPANGEVRLNLASALPVNAAGDAIGIFTAVAASTLGLTVEVAIVGTTQLQVTVTDAAGSAVNLSTTAVTIQLVGGTPA